MSHHWLKKASNNPLNVLNFNPILFINYAHGSNLKKIFNVYCFKIRWKWNSSFKKIFLAFDGGKNGQISFIELMKGLIQLKSSKINQNDVFNFFKAIDVDKNGKIDYTEFLAATLQKKYI